MSNFHCEQCDALCIDTPIGYVTGCEHHPHDCLCNKRVIGACAACAISERIEGGEDVQQVLRDYGY